MVVNIGRLLLLEGILKSPSSVVTETTSSEVENVVILINDVEKTLFVLVE